MLGRAGIPVNTEERKQVRKVFGISEKERQKIRKKRHLCGKNVQYQSRMQKERKKKARQINERY
jgi:hypothetical protein